MKYFSTIFLLVDYQDSISATSLNYRLKYLLFSLFILIFGFRVLNYFGKY